MTIAWVIGGNGLLGSALRNSLQRSGATLFIPAERFHWKNEEVLTLQLWQAVNTFATSVGSENGWQIYWAAGVGTMSSTDETLALETRVLSRLLNLVKSQQELVAADGCVAFASSAGAIYAGATDNVISENTSIAPTTAYAREKLKQENLISAFTVDLPGMTALLARISTLYGSGQATGKQQGLLAEIARRILRNQPIQIYVPFDTIRDYITADDAADLMVAAVLTISGRSSIFTKIIASEQPVTIAEIISIFKRITRRTPRIITCSSKLSSIYNRRIQFHSVSIPTCTNISQTSLLVGIAQLIASERSAFAASRA